MRYILFIVLTLFVMAACSKSEIPTWDAKARANFYMANDTVLFLFSVQPEGTTEGLVSLRITMAGKLADTDRQVGIKDLGGSSFNSGSKYEIVSAIIPAGKKTGEVLVKVYKTDNLDVANDTLSFEIVASEDFEPGQPEYLHNSIIISNLWTKPLWWDSSAESRLGYYSDKKLEIIYEVLGSDEVFENVDNWWDDEISIAVYKLNRYCIDNNVKYHPDDENVIRFESGSN